MKECNERHKCTNWLWVIKMETLGVCLHVPNCTDMVESWCSQHSFTEEFPAMQGRTHNHFQSWTISEDVAWSLPCQSVHALNLTCFVLLHVHNSILLYIQVYVYVWGLHEKGWRQTLCSNMLFKTALVQIKENWGELAFTAPFYWHLLRNQT